MQWERSAWISTQPLQTTHVLQILYGKACRKQNRYMWGNATLADGENGIPLLTGQETGEAFKA
jgi:hypothetical protein